MEENMKKFYKMISCGLSLAILFGLAACGGSDSGSTGEDATEKQVEATTEAKEEEKSEFKVGETWTVDGLWSITVNSVTETDERNEYADQKPNAVYMVDYTYSNLGYEDSTGMMDGLYIAFDDMIVDAEGTMGYEYPGNVTAYPQETPVGANCKAQACIGVDNPGTFTVEVSLYDNDYNEYKAKFIMDPEAEAVETDASGSNVDNSSALKVGETWTVDGQWEFTITDVHKTDERNEYADTDPEAVYVLDYTYKNLGYEDETGLMDGLYISIEESVVDSEGTMGYSYPGDIEKYPEETPVGATCNAQACIGVDHAGSFTVNVIQYDGNSQKQTQSFLVEAE